MTDYNVIAEVGITPARKRVDTWMHALAPYSPTVGGSARGMSELVITIPARSFEQAVTTGLAIMLHAVGDLVRFETLPTSEFDRRVNDVPLPGMIGATETAELLGVTRQRVQQMAAKGALPRMKVGKTLVFPRSTIEAMANGRAGLPRL